jgi:SMODS and SLOG-associating 2TM effector domain 1
MNEDPTNPAQKCGLPEWTVVGFSGHRQLEVAPDVAKGIHAALNRLASRHGPLAAISSAASGSDTLFLEEVARRGLPFHIVLPFPRDRFKADFNPAPEDWRRIEPLLAQALRVDELHGNGSDAEAYMEAGERTVDRADVVIVAWDGKIAGGLGGTADVVTYARALKKPLIWINPATGNSTEERLEQLPVREDVVPWTGNTHHEVERYFKESDNAARQQGPSARLLLQRFILLHLAASAVGLIGPILHISHRALYIAAALETLLLAVAFMLPLRHRKLHEQWLKARMTAEFCRSVLATWPMRRYMDRPVKIALQGIEPLTHNLRLMQELDRTAEPAFETAREDYLEERVGDQLEYFEDQSKRSKSAFRRLGLLGRVCTVVAALATVNVILLHIVNAEGMLLQVPIYLSLTLPLASSALFLLILTQEHSRRAARYGEMAALLREKAVKISAEKTWHGLARLAGETEELMLQEVVEWHSFTRFVAETH